MPNKVLIADDEALWANLIKGILEGHNHEVVITLKGHEVADLALREKVDLVLLDVNFPDANGFDICHRIKSNPITQDIPVVLLTAQSDPSDLKKGLEIGASDYVEKHSSSLELLARVQAVLREKIKWDEMNYSKKIVESSIYMIGLIFGEKIVFANQNFLKYFGYDNLDALKQIDYKSLINDEDINSFESFKNECLNQNTIKHFEFKGKKKDGSINSLKAEINKIRIGQEDMISIYCKVVE